MKETVLLVVAAAAAGCLSKNAPAPVRYFEPKVVGAADGHDAVGQSAAATPPLLALDRVEGAAYLEAPMSWRLSEIEVAFDGLHHWVSRPPRLVSDALRRSLFLNGPFVEVDSRDAARLDVQLVAFEGVRTSPVRARVAVMAALRSPPSASGDMARRTHLFEAEEPLASSTPEALAEGMGVALASLLEQLVAWVDGAARQSP